MARRFTCTEDGSSKFWEGATEGSALTTRWGKVGTAGQSKTKSFASPEAAQKEFDKLVHEKLGKGYVEEGDAPATGDAAAVVAPKAATGPKLGRYTQALLALLSDRKKRDTPEPSAARWLERETRPELRALFATLAERRTGGVSVGDFWFNTLGVSDALGGRVPRAGASDQDRDDVIHLGSTGGGDLYVTATPGTSESSKIWLIIHDEDWTDGESWPDLEDFLEDRVKTYREEEAEQGTPKKEIKTDLDEYLKRPKAAAAPGAETPIAGGALTLVAVPDAKTRDRREENISKEAGYFFYGKRSSDGEWEDWHGRYAFASIPFPVPDYGWPGYQVAIFDRGGDKPQARVVEPRVVKWWAKDGNYQGNMPYGWRADASRLLVSGAVSVALDRTKEGLAATFERGRGRVVEVDPATGAGTLVLDGPDELTQSQVADTLEAVGWVGPMVGILRKGKKVNALELRERNGTGWKMVRSIPCGRCDKLLTLAGDRIAIVTKKKGAKAKSYLLGVRGTDLRLLGTLEGVVEDTFTSADGVALVGSVVSSHMKWAELRHIDEALERAFEQPAADLALA
jgi:predicted DNA-binding WGR domain protein